MWWRVGEVVDGVMRTQCIGYVYEQIERVAVVTVGAAAGQREEEDGTSACPSPV